MPEQSGFTITPEALNRQWNTSMMVNLGYAKNDPPATERSCNGWYWSVIPAILLGLTVRYLAILAMHGFNRSQQTKKPLLYVMRRNTRVALKVVVYVLVFCVLFAVTTWTFLRETPYELKEPDREEFTNSIIDSIF